MALSALSSYKGFRSSLSAPPVEHYFDGNLRTFQGSSTMGLRNIVRTQAPPKTGMEMFVSHPVSVAIASYNYWPMRKQPLLDQVTIYNALFDGCIGDAVYAFEPSPIFLQHWCLTEGGLYLSWPSVCQTERKSF
jgi:hypothetical protein